MAEVRQHSAVAPVEAACRSTSGMATGTFDSIQGASHIDVAQFLCALRLDPFVATMGPSARANFAMKTAAEAGRVDVVRYLCEFPLDPGVNPSVDDDSAVGWAARDAYLDVVRYI